MAVQFLEFGGERVAVLPVAEFDRLVTLAEDHDDIEAAKLAEARRLAGEEYIPGEVVDRIVDGEPPLRVWRQFRQMTLESLGRAVGLGKSYLSELERGKKAGKPVQWRALADALDVQLDDIVPVRAENE